MAYTKRGLYTVCQAGDCGRPHSTKGWCTGHAWRVQKFGVGPHALRPLKSTQKTDPPPGRYRRITIDGRTVFEHRVVLEQLLGRQLTAQENVHHRNGDRLDNRPENLELWSSSQPPGQRVEDKVAWAIELLRQYSPASLNHQAQGEQA